MRSKARHLYRKLGIKGAERTPYTKPYDFAKQWREFGILVSVPQTASNSSVPFLNRNK
jgi:hypothetical protein